MKRSKAAFLSLVAALGLALSAGPGLTQSLEKDIVGTWGFVSSNAYGPNPQGSFTFDTSGHFSAILMKSDLPKYASNNRTQGTAAEYKATVEGSLAYFGTYSVSGTDLILHVVGSTFPNWNGTDQRRTNVSVKGDELTYVQPTPSGGGATGAPNVWKRMK